MAKGSDKWGQGGGPRIRVEVILAVLVAVSLVGVYFYYLEGRGLSGTEQGGVTTVTTTGIGCNDSSLPPAAESVEANPTFLNLSDGLCYNYMGGSVPSVMLFAYYNGTIAYPCGDAPFLLPASVIQVQTDGSGGVTAAQLVSPSAAAPPAERCASAIPLEVASVTSVESTIPAVPQLNVTLTVPVGGMPIASVQAVLTLDGGSQKFQFNGVTATTPLTSPNSVSSTEIVLSDLAFSGNEVYPMTISGTYSGGQTFSYVVHFQVYGAP